MGEQLRLLSRPGCHLCEAVARDLRRLGVEFEDVNVEADAVLEEAYGEAIPVLLWGDAELARAPIDSQDLKHELYRAGVLSALR